VCPVRPPAGRVRPPAGPGASGAGGAQQAVEPRPGQALERAPGSGAVEHGGLDVWAGEGAGLGVRVAALHERLGGQPDGLLERRGRVVPLADVSGDGSAVRP
jgi:hypothetical protein